MNISFKLIFVLCAIALFSCRGTGSKSSDADGDYTVSGEEYVAGDTISTQKEDFDIDKFIDEKEQAELEVESKIESTLKEDVKVAAKPKKKSVSKPVKKYYPQIEFLEETYEVGDIVEGDVIKHIFKFKNTGKAPLNVEKAEGTCGCTQPSYPFLAIAPGEFGQIGVHYHSVGKSGPQKPEIVVHSDAKNEPIKTLYLVLDVKDKPVDLPVDSLELKEG